MKPVYQTIFTPPYGNCTQACIASIFELSLEDVPNFALDGDEWWNTYETFLLEQFNVYPLSLDVTTDYTREEYQTFVQGYHLIQGKSPRGEWDHVIVGQNLEPVHDPNPYGGCTLDDIRYYEIFVKKM